MKTTIRSLTWLLALSPWPGLLAGSLQRELVVHLAFDAGLQDSSGLANHATAGGPVEFQPGRLGQAVRVTVSADGATNNVVWLGYPPALKFGSLAGAGAVDFSAAFWIQLAQQAGDQPLLSNKDWNSGAHPGWGIFSQPDGSFKWNYCDDSGADRKDGEAPGNLRDGQWHHVAVVFERRAAARTYLDGQPVRAGSLAPAAGQPGGSADTDARGFSVCLGTDGTGFYNAGGTAALDALFDDLGIWRRALADAEVQRIFAAAQAGKDLSQIAEVTLPVITEVRKTGGSLVFSWAGGQAPYQVQKTTRLDSPAWENLGLPGNDTHFTNQISGAATFFRVTGAP